MTFDGKAFGKDIVETTKAYIEKTVAPLLSEIAALKAELTAANAATQKAVDAHGAKLALLVKDEVGNVLAGWEKPKDGRDGSDGAPGTKGDPGSAGKDGQNGRDGVGLASAMIDRTGTLILTLSDGTMRELGHVVGKDADMVTVKGMIDEATRKAIADAMAAIPMPKDGRDGIDGKDGAAGVAGKDGMNGADGKDGAAGRDGKDAEPITKEQIVEAVLATDALSTTVEQYLSDNPPQSGKDGRDGIDGKDGAAGRDGADGKNGENGAPGERGPAGEKGDPGEPGQAGTDGRDGKDGTNGVDGKSVTLDDVQPIILQEITKAVSTIPVPKDGKDGVSVTVADVAPMIEAEIEKAITLIPSAIAQTVEDEIAKLPPAEPGKDADPEIIKQMVATAVAELPPAQNGKDGVTVDELLPIIGETVAKAVSALPVPKDGRDGVDVKDLLVVEGGDLVATFTDGRTKVLGQFRGKDGDPGKDGADGANGKDGADGMGFDDVTEDHEDEGRVTVRRFFHAGQMVKETRIQTRTPIFRGVHDHAKTYLPGDMVTRGGSVWHCDVECQGPFNGDNFTLAAKKGRDGKPD